MKSKLKNNKLFIFSIIFCLTFIITFGIMIVPKLAKSNFDNSIDPSYKEVTVVEPEEPEDVEEP